MSPSRPGASPHPCRPALRGVRPSATRLAALATLLDVLRVAVVAVLLLSAVAPVGGCGGEAGGAPAAPASRPPTDPGLSPEPVPSDIASTSSGASTGGVSGALTVYLLGGSAACECIVSNAAWSAELSGLVGADVRAVDLGATNQSFTADRRYVCNMEDGAKVVLIGVGPGRYTSPPPPNVRCDKKLSPPLQQALGGELEVEHRYTEKQVKSVEDKERQLALWLAERYPLFRRNYAANRDELEELLGECRERGFSAVLLELPLNLEVVGDDLDWARETYVKDCRKLAAKYQVPWITFVDELALPNTSFYDLVHLVEPGREPWQTRLSEGIAPLLAPLVAGEE